MKKRTNETVCGIERSRRLTDYEECLKRYKNMLMMLMVILLHVFSLYLFFSCFIFASQTNKKQTFYYCVLFITEIIINKIKTKYIRKQEKR